MEQFSKSQATAPAQEAPRTAYDYIIVGAGSAGCVVARRLIEGTDAHILVLEAGGSDDGIDTISNPLRWLENIGAPHDYLYQYQPTPHVNNRVIFVPRGKVLGGSGSINAMVWARGHHDDYNGWAADNPGWYYQSVLPLFKKAEDWEGGETLFTVPTALFASNGPPNFIPSTHPLLNPPPLTECRTWKTRTDRIPKV